MSLGWSFNISHVWDNSKVLHRDTWKSILCLLCVCVLRRSQQSLLMPWFSCSWMWYKIKLRLDDLMVINRTQNYVPLRLNNELLMGWMDKCANLSISRPHTLSGNINQNGGVVRSNVGIPWKWHWSTIHQTVHLPASKMHMDVPSARTTIRAMKYESTGNIVFHSSCSEYLAFKIHRASCGVLSEFW